MAGYSAYGKLDALVLLPIQSIAMGSSTFVGQNAGARKVERIKKGIKVAFLLSLSLTVVLIIPMMVFAPRLISLFNNDAEVIKYGALFIRLISPFYPTICVNQILAGSLRGVGDAKAPMYIMLGSFVVFRQIYLFISSRIFVGNLLPIAFAYPSGWVVCSVLIYIYFRHSRWEERCLL